MAPPTSAPPKPSPVMATVVLALATAAIMLANGFVLAYGLVEAGTDAEEARSTALRDRKTAYIEVVGSQMLTVRVVSEGYSEQVDQYLNHLLPPEWFAVESARLAGQLEAAAKHLERTSAPPVLFDSHQISVKAVYAYHEAVEAVSVAVAQDDRQAVAAALVELYDAMLLLDEAEAATADSLGLNVH